MGKVKVLDVTLRDGGCVNDFNFGQCNMEQILDALESSGVEYIEVGYIDQKKGTKEGRTQYCSEQVIYQNFLKAKKRGTTYVAMIDYGKFDIDLMEKRNGKGIDGIRMAFHKKDRFEALELGKKIMEKGYQFFIQPMITLRYSDQELLELIEYINRELPNASGFYLVDSFGEMRPEDLRRMMNLVDHKLISSMAVGFHSHNNLQMSYADAAAFLEFSTQRERMLDCSLLGMGKGAGNLNTELLLEHMNLFYGKKYHTKLILKVIDDVMNQIRSEYRWGYAIEYYLSSIYHCTPGYASCFYKTHMLPIDQVAELLNLIREDKKVSFDREYAEKLYLEYKAGKKPPRISVIMGIYNCSKTLAGAIESILNQTFSEWELILCDDGSEDETYQTAKKYADQYKDKITLLKNEKNKGLNYTLNRCLKLAKGEYVARMDGDDLCSANRFELEIEVLDREKDIAIVSTDMSYFDETGTWGEIVHPTYPEKKDFLHGTPFCHAPCMVRKEAYFKVGGYSERKLFLRVEDYHLWIKMYQAGYRGKNIHTTLYQMRDDRNACDRRKLKYRINEMYVRMIAVKELGLPVTGYLRAVRPILTGVLPRVVYQKIHKRKLTMYHLQRSCTGNEK